MVCNVSNKTTLTRIYIIYKLAYHTSASIHVDAERFVPLFSIRAQHGRAVVDSSNAFLRYYNPIKLSVNWRTSFGSEPIIGGQRFVDVFIIKSGSG